MPQVRLNGGKGNDLAIASLNLTSIQDSTIDVVVLGGRGDDFLVLLAPIDPPGGAKLHRVVDGGPGRDRGVVSEGIETYRCDVENTVPAWLARLLKRLFGD